MSRAIATVVFTLALIISGCREDGTSSKSADEPSADVTRDNLPELPDATVLTEDPAVQAQISEALRQVQQSPKDHRANGRLGMIYDAYRLPIAAEICYRRAATLSGSEFKWYYLLGTAQRELGQAQSAVGSLSQAIAINANYAPAHVSLGEVYLELGKIDEAESTFRRAIQIDERSCTALTGLGKIVANRGDHPGALALYERALKFAPNYAPLHYAVGLSFRETNQLPRAKTHFDLANAGTKHSPDRDPIRASVAAMETGLRADYLRAQAKIDAGDLDGAIEILRRIVAADPNYYGARGRLAFALYLKGDADEAIVQYEQAIHLNPDNVDFLRPFTLLLIRSNRLDEARKSMQHVIELGGGHADDHEILGVVLSMQNRRRDAIEQFELSLELDPAHVRSRDNLIKLLRAEIAAASSDETVLPYLRRYVQFNPTDPRVYVMLGRILDQQGDLRGALKALDAALALNPNIPEVRQRAEELRQLLNSTSP